MRLLQVLMLAILVIGGSAATNDLIRKDKYIPRLLDHPLMSTSLWYTQMELSAIAQQYPANYPIPDSFDDPQVRSDLRKNVLIILEEVLDICSHLNDVEATPIFQEIQDIYANDDRFNSRALPYWYNHVLRQDISVLIQIFQTMVSPHVFYLDVSTIDNYHSLAFGQSLPKSLGTNSTNLFYSNFAEQPNDYWMDGTFCWDAPKPQPINTGNIATSLSAWSVVPDYEQQVFEAIANISYPVQNWIKSKYMHWYAFNLEKAILSIAHVYTTDRANALISGSIYVQDIAWQFSLGDNNYAPRVGEMVYIGAPTFTYFISVIYNSTHYLGNNGLRQPCFAKIDFKNQPPTPMGVFVPNTYFSDPMTLFQIRANGEGLNYPPKDYSLFLQSVADIEQKLNEQGLPVLCPNMYKQDMLLSK